MAAADFLLLLRSLAAELPATSCFSDEQAAEGLAVTDELRACFLPRPASASPAVSQPAEEQVADLLQLLPPELLSAILSRLDLRDLAHVAATCPSLWRDAATSPPMPRAIGPVEAELRRRAEARGLEVGSSLPEGAHSWVSYLFASDRRDTLRRQAPLAVGFAQRCRLSSFVDREGHLLTCGLDGGGAFLLGHPLGPEADPDDVREIGFPMLVPWMQGTRVVSVATGIYHCLALSTVGEVYSWGGSIFGELGHLDRGVKELPSRIESLSRIEHIAAGPYYTSAAIDETGNLYTWGRAFTDEDPDSVLGYEVDPETLCQLTPRRLDALSQHCVVGVALGHGFTLAVTDAGAVFSFGCGRGGQLGHWVTPFESEVLPRRIEALAQTRRRFVAVAAGESHALALTEDGELYEWGRGQLVPQRIAELVGQQVKLVYAVESSSCAVTEHGELYSWSSTTDSTNHHGHGVGVPQQRPKRVEGLGEVTVAAVAMCSTHTLVASEDGVVWGFGMRCALGLDDNFPMLPYAKAEHPTRIPALRVRALKSPPVVRL